MSPVSDAPTAPQWAKSALATYTDVTARLDSLLHHSLFYDYNVEIVLLIIKYLTASVAEIKI